MPRSFAIGVISALVLTGAFAERASAACANPANAGPFVIDGIIGDTGAGANGACNNSGVSPGATKVTDPNGSTKELGPVNGTNTKLNVINSATPPMLGLTNPNGQVDLNTIYTQTAPDPATNHVWYYFAWARDSNSGSGFISIELQKSGIPSGCNYSNLNTNTCNPWSGRAEGDIMILWDQSGSSTDIYLRTYHVIGGVGGFGAPMLLDPTKAVAKYSTDLFRGEAGIDFTALVFPNDGSCTSFANTIPGTVTGNSDTADYKDAVLSAFPPVSNCGIVTVTKVTSPAGLAGNFSYTLSATGGIFGLSSDIDSDCTNNSQASCVGDLVTPDNNGSATETISNLQPKSSYTLTESTVDQNFTLARPIVCVQGTTTYNLNANTDTFTVVAGAITACTITNNQNPGFYAVKKVVVNGFGLSRNSEDFCYLLDSSQTCTAFLANSASASTQFAAGTTHTVTEPAAGQITGYTVSYSNECLGGAASTVTAGATTTCTVTNTAQQATPGALTRQRVLLYDRAQATNVRRIGDGSDAGTMSFTFNIYLTQADCTAEQNSQGSEVVNVTFGSNIATTSNLVGTSTLGYEIKLDTAGDTGSLTRYWRALFHQTGTNPPNGDKKTECVVSPETTTVRIVQ